MFFWLHSINHCGGNSEALTCGHGTARRPTAAKEENLLLLLLLFWGESGKE
jgi:hypothetical protein